MSRINFEKCKNQANVPPNNRNDWQPWACAWGYLYRHKYSVNSIISNVRETIDFPTTVGLGQSNVLGGHGLHCRTALGRVDRVYTTVNVYDIGPRSRRLNGSLGRRRLVDNIARRRRRRICCLFVSSGSVCVIDGNRRTCKQRAYCNAI